MKIDMQLILSFYGTKEAALQTLKDEPATEAEKLETLTEFAYEAVLKAINQARQLDAFKHLFREMN